MEDLWQVVPGQKAHVHNPVYGMGLTSQCIPSAMGSKKSNFQPVNSQRENGASTRENKLVWGRDTLRDT
jgi:hypothetical protein